MLRWRLILFPILTCTCNRYSGALREIQGQSENHQHLPKVPSSLYLQIACIGQSKDDVGSGSSQNICFKNIPKNSFSVVGGGGNR